MHDQIEVCGATTHNLKNLDVSFPRNKLVVLTGVSGSGKSSLAFDTIYAEGKRRYMATFSNYVRHALGGLPRPEVDKINGLSPVVAVEQKTIHNNPRSTVGSITEVYDFLRLLFAKIGQSGVATDGRLVYSSSKQVLDHLLHHFLNQLVTCMAPIVWDMRSGRQKLLDRFIHLGFTKIYLNGQIISLEEGMQSKFLKNHELCLVVDHIHVSDQVKDRIHDGLQLAMQHGQGEVIIMDQQGKCYTFLVASNHRARQAEPIMAKLFSFNVLEGACATCRGLGKVNQPNLSLVVPNRAITIRAGAIVPLGPYKNSLIFAKIEAVLRFYGHQIDDPVDQVPLPVLHLLLFGNVSNHRIILANHFLQPFTGVLPLLAKEKAYSSFFKQNDVYGFRGIACPACHGARLKPQALAFTIRGKNIAELSHMSIDGLQEWFTLLPRYLNQRDNLIGSEPLKEINKRLNFLMEIGLHYLELDRSVGTLSGGETQRLRLAAQIGTGLLGVLYIFDEPSIGLHQRDNMRLISALQRLRDLGNTVLVVEHDKDMMHYADYLIEIGPQSGLCGGQVVAAGNGAEFLKQPSITADFLTQKKCFPWPKTRHKGNGTQIVVQGCRGHNLKNITLTLPLGVMVCVTGVSGSGKSSLIRKTLLPLLQQKLHGSHVQPLAYQKSEGLAYIDRVVEVDQSPIGATPRSNPSTYTGILTEVRNLFAGLAASKARGYQPGRFSFNLKPGHCATCEGVGMDPITMRSEIHVICQACQGARYNRETLQIRYKEKSIADVLAMSVDEAMDFFVDHPTIRNKLSTLRQVGLGYITLGQQATTLSGGEAQRMKLSEALSKKSKGSVMYILDEPSTGLHFKDVLDLVGVLRRLVDQGNSVLIIEHNMDIIQLSDYLIDLGPEGGDEGGYLVAEGTPEEVSLVVGSHTGRFLQQEMNQ